MMAARTATRAPRGRSQQPARRFRPAWTPVPSLIFFGLLWLWLGIASGTVLLTLIGVAKILTAAWWAVRR